MKTILAIIIIAVALLCIHQHHIISDLTEYRTQAESLLDTLDRRYNWTDAVDHEDYYETTRKLTK